MSLHLTPCPKPLTLTIAAAAAALALAGCGGGGSGGGFLPLSTSAPAPAAQAPAAPPVAPSELPTDSTSKNDAPVSNAGTAQSTITGKAFKLDGSASSDADGDALTYKWTLANKPATSTAALASPTDAKPEFTADVAGDYEFSLIVNDGKADSESASVTVTVALATWHDADCSQTGTALPACSTNFSDNHARAEIATESNLNVIQLSTDASSPSSPSSNNGVTGNKAVYGLNFLHKVKLSEFPGISFAMKLNTGDTTLPVDAYVNYTISLTCDGANWVNLVTGAGVMTPSGVDSNGYATYSAKPSEVKWAKTGTAGLVKNGTTLLNGVNGTGGGPLALDALIAAYPNACIYNFQNPLPGGISPTPAVVINLGDSSTLTAKKAWFKDIKIGDKTVF